ncbi:MULTISPECIES: helix-turn-helix transcriptional regulator [Vreelandella]|uniref:Response regulator transcription factor n=2 Tax=Vreelandella TaxID=3137766 RepID=A0A7C9NW35_9GAMM|nr:MULTISPECIES: LuxR C-terminal-related transcriptional regulator [Halomonas]NDL69131.1 response regulator transcription factor [Halomonas alkaliphila]NYS44172.1 response regulator transcription factor [Halomonas zhaodongensis]
MKYSSSTDDIDSAFLANAGSAAWHRHLASLVHSAGQRDFPARLEQVLRAVTGFDTILINTYKGRNRPLLIHDDYPAENRQQAIDRYLSGAYLLDPFFTAIDGGLDSGVYRLRELAPDRFESSDYYAHYYRSLGLVDEVGLFARIGEDVLMVVSLGFQADAPLKRRSLQILRNVAPLVEVLLIEFWKWQGAIFQKTLEKDAPVEAAFASFGRELLTAREQEIVRLLLAGHSTKSAARELDISDGTVKVHRKHIYQRLDISSQSQLFQLFLEHVALISRQLRG